jgi:hypothetical protein
VKIQSQWVVTPGKQTNKQTNIQTYIHTYLHTYPKLELKFKQLRFHAKEGPSLKGSVVNYPRNIKKV